VPAAFDLPIARRDDGIDWRERRAAIVTSPALARSVAVALAADAARLHAKTVVLSGGLVQNQLLLADPHAALASRGLSSWITQQVPPNDGG
jgi:hydrogenase maturation factor HypF (carbamoyltransferase family)